MRKLLSLAASFAMALGVVAVMGSVPGAAGHTGHTISVNDVSANEGSGTATFTLTINQAAEQGETLSVNYATANNSATAGAGNDYTSTSGTATFGFNEGTTKFVPVPILDDGASEGNETFLLNLISSANTCVLPCTTSGPPAISDGQGVATIVDNETGPALSITDVSAFEGNLGATVFAFAVSHPASGQSVTVNYATADGTALAASDYQAQTGVLTFPAGSTTQNINILVNGDTTPETDETFFVNLSGATNATIADSQGVGTIRTDDGYPVGTATFIISDVSRGEGNTGSSPTTPFTFTVTLGQPVAGGATINFNTTDATATSGSDYVFTQSALVFAPTDTAKFITVPVVGDTTTEANEAFFVNLSGASAGTTITDNQGLGTISNDDGPAPTPTPRPGPTATDVKIGGYFQVRITAPAVCVADRTFKVKQSLPGTDRVTITGTTDAVGLYKEAVRPRKSGRFYAQVYPITVAGTSCPGKKSTIRQLPA